MKKEVITDGYPVKHYRFPNKKYSNNSNKYLKLKLLKDMGVCYWCDVQVVTLIRTTLARRGKGTKEDPMRIITQYWTMDGELEFEVDPVKEQDDE